MAVFNIHASNRGAAGREAPRTFRVGDATSPQGLATRLRNLALSPRLAGGHVAAAGVVAVALFVLGVPLLPLIAWGGVAMAHLGIALGRWAVSGAEEHPAVPADGGVVLTGSVSSVVRLDYDAGTAEKTYYPTLLVRLLYRLAFQSPFPYDRNEAAADAAVERRTLTGLLTQFWFGENLVAPMLELRYDGDGRVTYVSELVRGTAPRDEVRARAVLRDLTERFVEAGLPSWQVGSYNPRAIGNLIEREDGAYRIIDLESNLVTPVMPRGALIRAIRLAQYPSFDEADLPRLDEYLDGHRDEIVATMGSSDAARLFEAAAAYGAAQRRWHAGERRYASRILRFAFRLVDVPSWVRGVRRMTAGGEQRAGEFAAAAVEERREEGHLSATEAERLLEQFALPEVAAASSNLGVHLAISVPLRFPLGSIARSLWTLSMRVKAEWRALRGRGSARVARDVHSIPVALLAAVPGIGTFAYMFAKPFRKNRALGALIFDRSLRKLPFSMHRRLHLSAYTTWLARPREEAPSGSLRSRIASGTRLRLRLLAEHAPLIATVVLANLAVLAISTLLFFRYDVEFAYSELGLLNSVDALQLFAAGLIGLAVFRAFWRQPAARASADEAAGSFLWGLTGLGLIFFAFDDGLGFHEWFGDWVAAHANVLPLLTNNTDDFVTLGYGAGGLLMLAIFRHELLAMRASSVLLIGGVLASGLMLASDAYGVGPLTAIERPAQVLGVALLLLAHLVRYRELTTTNPVPAFATEDRAVLAA